MSHKPATADTTTTTRLPCRGCQPGCVNYTLCEGKPWRLAPESKPVTQ